MLEGLLDMLQAVAPVDTAVGGPVLVAVDLC